MSTSHGGSGNVTVTFTGDLSPLRQAKQDAKQIVRDATRELQQEARAATSSIATVGSTVIQNAADIVVTGTDQVMSGAAGRLAKARTRAGNRRLRAMETNAARNMAGDDADELFGVDRDERSFRKFLADERRERAAGVRRAGRAVMGRSPASFDPIAELMPPPEVQTGMALRPGGRYHDPAMGEGLIGSIASRFGISGGTAIGAGVAYAGFRAIGSIGRAGVAGDSAAMAFSDSYVSGQGDSTLRGMAGFVGRNTFASSGPWGTARNALTFGRFGMEMDRANDAARGLGAAHQSNLSTTANFNAQLAAVSGDPMGAARFGASEMVRGADLNYQQVRRYAGTVRSASRRGTPEYLSANQIESDAAGAVDMASDLAAKNVAMTGRQFSAGVTSLRAGAMSSVYARRSTEAAIGGRPMDAFMADQQGSYLDLLSAQKSQMAGVAPGSIEAEGLALAHRQQGLAFKSRSRLALRQFIGNQPQALSFTNTLDAIGEGRANAMMGGYADKAEGNWTQKLFEAAQFLEGAAKSIDQRIQTQDASR